MKTKTCTAKIPDPPIKFKLLLWLTRRVMVRTALRRLLEKVECDTDRLDTVFPCWDLHSMKTPPAPTSKHFPYLF